MFHYDEITVEKSYFSLQALWSYMFLFWTLGSLINGGFDISRGLEKFLKSVNGVSELPEGRKKHVCNERFNRKARFWYRQM